LEALQGIFGLDTKRKSGGIVLWSRSFTPAASQLASSAASPVNSLIRDALIEGKNAEDHYEKDGYAVRWTFFNELELIFVVRSTIRGLIS
jgi:signal recognition particle receptor subunit alpha